MKKTLNTILLSVLISSSLFAQDWIVPDDQKTKRADFEFTEASVEAGAALFLTNCKSCHGMPGENNFIPLVPPPGDPASDKVQHNNDGELYYKLREGRGQMPSFKNILSIQQIWEVISYLRSFNENYIQEVAIAAANNRWSDIQIALTLLEAEKQLRAQVSGMEGELRTPVAGAEVKLLVQRRFGNLAIGEPVMTNGEGVALFKAPTDLPGDPEGNLALIAQMNNEEEFGLVKTEVVLQAGLPLTPVSLREKRAMWNTVQKAPIWIILTYSLGVLTVWSFIMFVMLQLRSIFKLGEKEENKA